MAKHLKYFLRNMGTLALYSVILIGFGILCQQPFIVAIYLGGISALFLTILNEILQQLRKLTGEVDPEQFVRYWERFAAGAAAHPGAPSQGDGTQDAGSDNTN